ncbi:MAG TPA: 3-hydroxyacyl-CoA dehydrogenase family protein [Gemmatimonadaceae bacterium]|jgi:3-hydroxybutyryl-CoA dehydrogenase|nr:3-hydroxyacyl-CoA dehydrogenase family protein [Gemmatimonadaceae bacterium]
MTQIRTVAIVGAGTMGRRIAFDCVRCGVLTRLYDAAPGMAEDAINWVHSMMDKWRQEGRVTSTVAKRAVALLDAANTLDECARDVDLAIESVPENIALKQQVFRLLDRVLPPNALMMSNTSAIPASRLAIATERPERVLNVNFGHLGHRKVEMMGHAGTSPQTIAAVREFLRELGFLPIVVRGESVGYATNRVWRAVKKEVLKLLDRELVSAEDIDRGWMLDWGTNVGPCGLMDHIGLDVVRDIELIYYDESGDEDDRPPPLLDRMLAAGKLGTKSGEGFYRYPNPTYEQPGFLDASPSPTEQPNAR